MVSRFYMLVVAILSALLCSCAIDYSPLQVAPVGSPQAHIASGIIDADGIVWIEAVNGISTVSVAPTQGREVIIPAGKANLWLRFSYARLYSSTAFDHEFAPNHYYIITGRPNFAYTKITFEASDVSEEAFNEFLCEVQQKVQRYMAGVNPQKTPACEKKRAGNP